jgi:hypothetical protein
MASKYETPTVKAGASRDFLGGPSHDSLTLAAPRAQFLIGLGTRPEIAALLAAFIFGGAA